MLGGLVFISRANLRIGAYGPRTNDRVTISGKIHRFFAAVPQHSWHVIKLCKNLSNRVRQNTPFRGLPSNLVTLPLSDESHNRRSYAVSPCWAVSQFFSNVMGLV